MVEDLEARLNAGLEATNVAGASLGVLNDGEIEIAHGGSADLGCDMRVSGETRFQVASLTKPMVATVIAKLASEQRLRLEDPIAVHVPELGASDWGARVTVLDLLANRAGVPMTTAVEFEFDADGDDCLAQFAAAVAPQQLLFEPGTSWSYSNTAWCLLGRAIECVCGASWEEAMRSELFDPLAMEQTLFTSVDQLVEPATGYVQREDGAIAAELWSRRSLGPAGGTVWSTVRDLLRFARVHLEDGQLPDGSRYVSAGVLPALQTVEERRSLPDFMDGWARGWAQLDWPGGPVWGWCGIADGHRSILQLVPGGEVALALMTISNNGRDLYRAVFPLELGRFGVTMPPLDVVRSVGSRDLQRYAGIYAWPDYELVVSAHDGHLRVVAPDLAADAFPVSRRVFALSPEDADVPVIVFDDFDAHARPRLVYVVAWAYPRVSVL